jgi:hypothetical protein
LVLISAVSEAGTLSCELIYAKDGNVQRANKTMEVKPGDDSKSLDLSIENLVEAQIFRGSNGKMSASMDRIGGESNRGITDGGLLHMTAENSDEGRALTCTYLD